MDSNGSLNNDLIIVLAQNGTLCNTQYYDPTNTYVVPYLDGRPSYLAVAQEENATTDIPASVSVVYGADALQLYIDSPDSLNADSDIVPASQIVLIDGVWSWYGKSLQSGNASYDAVSI